MMKTRALLTTLLAGAAVALASPAEAQRGGGRPRPPRTVEVPTGPGIAWFGTWEGGLAEAERTGRPILLMSAAPQCHGVPGMW